MPVTINGTTGIAGVDGSASTPSYQGTDTNTGIFYPAADTIAFAEGGSEAMRIDSSGNVGIGTSSPAAKLELGSGTLLLSNNVFIQQKDSSGTARNVAGVNSSNQYSIGGLDGSSTVDTVRILTGGTERARITSGGELLLARTTLVGTERFSIDVDGSKQGQCIRSTNTSGNPNIFRIATGQLSGGISTGRFITCDDGGGDKFFVAGSGTVNSTSTSITAISDQRLKENVRDLEIGLSEIMQLTPRRFDWKEGQGTGKKNVVGFIAQEVELVLPDLIGEWKNQDDETIYKSLAMGDMLPTLVKAIQELKSELDAAKARIAVLEAK